MSEVRLLLLGVVICSLTNRLQQSGRETLGVFHIVDFPVRASKIVNIKSHGRYLFSY